MELRWRPLFSKSQKGGGAEDPDLAVQTNVNPDKITKFFLNQKKSSLKSQWIPNPKLWVPFRTVQDKNH
jgi:hypothetical protein